MNSFLISICLMFSSLPYCNVEKLTNDEFAQSFGYENYKIMRDKEKECISLSLKDTPKLNCDVEKARDSKEELKKCEKSSKEGIEKIKKNIQSKEFKNNQCTAWLIGWDDSNISKEYERRKNE